MSKKITFFILGDRGASVRQTTVSKSFLGLFALFCFLSAAVLGLLGYDYWKLRTASFDNRALEGVIAGQKRELVGQRRQIQEFAGQINELKAKIVELNGFEEKIRIIANIKAKKGDDSIFGVGGSMPEDLDTRVDLEGKHNSLLREMHGQVDQLKEASLQQEEGFKQLYKYLEDQRNLLAATPAIRPAKGWVTSDFGYRESPFTGRREFHKGVDIANRRGTPIVATGDGIVTFSGKKGLLGRLVVIDHGHGMVTRYGHLKEGLKKRGEKVKRGDVIAEMGNSGRSTGPHVHYEVRLNGVPVNPNKYILN